MDFELGPEGMGCRKLFGRIKNLPPDAALWRVQNVNTPAPTNAYETKRAKNSDEVKQFLGEHFGQPTTDRGGTSFSLG